jgi:hypothetical protein
VGTDAGCPAGRTITISLPALATIGHLNAGFNIASRAPALCHMTFSAPSLATATDQVGFGGGVTGVTPGGNLTAASLNFVNTSMSTIDMPAVHLTLSFISENSSLTSLGGGSGTIGSLSISSNPNLSTEAAQTWAQRFTIGNLSISGNKVP